MIDGILVINLDPPYAGFSSESGQFWKDCTVDELNALLIEIKGFMPGTSWPPREYVLRLPGHFSKDALAKFGLINLATLRSIHKPQQMSPLLNLLPQRQN